MGTAGSHQAKGWIRRPPGLLFWRRICNSRSSYWGKGVRNAQWWVTALSEKNKELTECARAHVEDHRIMNYSSTTLWQDRKGISRQILPGQTLWIKGSHIRDLKPVSPSDLHKCHQPPQLIWGNILKKKQEWDILVRQCFWILHPFLASVINSLPDDWSYHISGFFFFEEKKSWWNLNAILSYSIYHQPGVAQQEKWDHFPQSGKLSLPTFILLPTSCFSINMSAASKMCQIWGDRGLSPLWGDPPISVEIHSSYFFSCFVVKWWEEVKEVLLP